MDSMQTDKELLTYFLKTEIQSLIFSNELSSCFFNII